MLVTICAHWKQGIGPSSPTTSTAATPTATPGTSTDTRNTHNKRGRLSEVSLGIAHSVRHHSPLSVISKSWSRNNTNWSRMDMAVLQRKMALRTYNLVMLA
ncbi:uncharacterized protein LOC124272661 [Haliotis rubra]|uniref:uncharacterized protein LOC124272661 n=1 Tax=Haliotis rubra TaxID=36100 RepID=UPI001EE54CAC|nr:uncharacterized protein LOC124272661 [Haliotis rubra]